jgi:REP element-mobilizing transposase RayT
MKYDPERHHRRSIRLKDYDYSRCGAYFVTICTQERLCLFGDVVDDEMVLSDAGAMIERRWAELPEKYIGIQIDAFVVMPNHIHGIVLIDVESSVGAAPRGRPVSRPNEIESRSEKESGLRDEGQPQGVAPTDDRRISLSDVVHRYKSFTTNRYSKGVRELGWFSFPGRLWQRNFYEHVIRNDDELNRICEYIHENPRNWASDDENPANIAANKKLHGTSP